MTPLVRASHGTTRSQPGVARLVWAHMYLVIALGTGDDTRIAIAADVARHVGLGGAA